MRRSRFAGWLLAVALIAGLPAVSQAQEAVLQGTVTRMVTRSPAPARRRNALPLLPAPLPLGGLALGLLWLRLGPL